MTSFAYPRLSRRDFGLFRVGGSGLGNLLFPWARAVLACRRHGLELIAPTWPQLKLGPVLRREADPRFYTGLFETPCGQPRGPRRLWLLATLSRLPEAALARDRPGDGARKVFVFEGIGGFFQPLLSEHELIRRALVGMIRRRHLAGLDRDFSHTLSVHVRRGDFSPPRSAADAASADNVRLPIDWYLDIVAGLSARFDPPPAVRVFSDGRDDELAPLLELPGAKRLDFGSSVADLLALSRSRVLVASASTFSMWASYLGRMPTVWYPGQLRQRLFQDRPAAEIECGKGEDIPDAFIDAVEPAGPSWSPP